MTTMIRVNEAQKCQFDDDTVIGRTIFTVADIRLALKNQLQREPTNKELSKALDSVVENHLESAMCVAGWEYIESVL